MPINRAPFNALIDDDGSNTTGTPWNKAQIAGVVLDPIETALRANTGFATTGILYLAGGTTLGSETGAVISVNGNTSGSPGQVGIELGNVAASRLVVWTGSGSEAVTIDGASGTAVFTSAIFQIAVFNSTAANGGFLALQRSGTPTLQLGSAINILGAGGADDVVLYAPLTGAKLYLECSGTSGGSIRSFTIYNDAAAAPANLAVAADGRITRATSSRRYKTDIQPLTEWRWLLDLEAVEFADRQAPAGRKYAGFTAEDVVTHSPQRNGMPMFAAVTAHGPEDVAYAPLVAVLQLGLKDLDRRLAALETR